MVRNRWLILANVSVGTFMATLDGSIANVALPTISEQMDTPVHVVQWVLTAYLLTICATLPIMGKISDIFGRSRVYNYGFLLFVFGSALCALSVTLPMLIVSRVLQALGASCLMTNSQAIVAEAFPANERGRAMGITGTTVSLGSLSGPALGGVLVGQLGWPSIFWINVPIGIIGFIAGLFLLPKGERKPRTEPFDYTGSGLFMAGMVLFLFILSNGQDLGWLSAATLAGGFGSIALLVMFYRVEKRTKHPMLDFSLYRNRTFAIGNVTAMLSFVSLFCMNVMMPFYMQNLLGFTPEQTGYTMMIYPLTMAVIAPLSGWLSDRIGPNLLTTAGLAMNALAFALLNTLTADESAWLIGLHLVLFGVGGGLFQSPNNASVMSAVPRQQLGTAGGLNALVRNVGMVMGIAISVSLYTTVLGRYGAVPESAEADAAMLAALHTVFWTAAGICLAALAVSARRLRTKGTLEEQQRA
ncbi:EmrB/QacA subfamily drug resistance transporter [Paenibacillus phyllosphaerae]|uniref:EmrB/QacA subfamily drug resistance transporter n=1 Tax=Paenibacillus phyllosphaerae TaxID=274593 RepID=A0A7W5FKZ8_9BACL|nr:MFS transporter [Paenibacillus phyllosphaerae]MBB3108641.1 EmrB/QacA subfamily drug resistance transporter [Paenibacillus phyllosphaerae]